MLPKRIFLTICLLSILNSGWAKSIKQTDDNTKQQQSSQTNTNTNIKNNIDLTDIQSKAEKGDSEAQYNLGVMYAEGYKDIQADILKAIEWYTLSANQGYVNAQYNLGLLYKGNEYIKPDYVKAKYWYEKAAAQGDIA
ncbi:tetratricopeptide repeat protein, partial [Acinetobacter baumannii]